MNPITNNPDEHKEPVGAHNWLVPMMIWVISGSEP